MAQETSGVRAYQQDPQQVGQMFPHQGIYPMASSSHSSSAAEEMYRDQQESAEEAYRDQEFSEDEDLSPDQSAFVGLFRPSVFRFLLYKARKLANMGPSQTPQDPTGPF